jgi:hypothetical protein
MFELMWVGIITGTMLYFSKWVGISLLLPKPAKHFIHNNAFTLGLLDLGLGYLCAKATQMAGGLTALIATATFGFWSMLFITSILAKKKIKSQIGGFI